MEAITIIEEILKNRSSYEKTVYLLNHYKDLKAGKEINEKNRSVLELIDKVINIVSDDEYIDIIKNLYVNGYTYEKTMEKMRIDRSTLYRNRRRIIRRMAIVIYGDEAL